MRVVSGVFVLIFLTGLFALGAIFHRKAPAHRNPQSAFNATDDQRDQKLLKSLPPNDVEAEIFNSALAKKNHFFWAMEPLHFNGVALRVVQDPLLFAQVFPGYPYSVTQDVTLWNHLFNGNMYVRDWVLLPPPSPSFLISHPTYSGIELFSRYGADVLIFGNSETSQAVSPGALKSGLHGDYSVLGMEVPGSTLRITREIANRLSASGKRAQWAILGVTLSNLFLHAATTQGSERGLLRALDDYDRESGEPMMKFSRQLATWRLQESFPVASWDEFPAMKRQAPVLSNGHGFPISWIRESHSPAELAKRLEEFSSHWRLQSDLFESISESDCSMSKAGIELALTLKSLSKISDRVLLYLTPSNSLELRQVPRCFLENAQKLLQTQADFHVSIFSDPDPSYGLTLADYVAIDEAGEQAYLDQNHLNAEGARKFTQSIGRFLRERMAHP